MRFTRIIIGWFLLMLVAGDAMAQKITTDFDPRANFSQYKTFTWIRPPKVEMDPFMEQRLVEAINAALTAKGWQPATEGADVGIVAHVATRERHTLETFYNGFGGGWGWHHWGVGFGEAYTTDHPYEVGTLVVDMFDSHTKQLIWRGVATETFSEKPDKDTKKLNKDVEKLFKGFPPR
ncbi:MAG: DUF4136 domain-containing protein [Candidatus Acidiferrales bacterium]